MSTSVQRTPKSGSRSLFFHDLVSPVSARIGKFSPPGQAEVMSARGQENWRGSDLPPPPMFTLEDRSDFSPEFGITDFLGSPEIKTSSRTPARGSSQGFYSPLKGISEMSVSHARLRGQQTLQGSGGSSLWSPVKSNSETNGNEKGSPVDCVVHPGALITLPPQREVAKPETLVNQFHAENNNEDGEWVTVYGFSSCGTNLVLQEFEKCGVILKHIPGPLDGNWMQILYQSRCDAQKALSRNGTQINGVLIVGVKLVDPMQHQYLNEKLDNQGFMTLPATSFNRSSVMNSLRGSPQLYYPQNSGNSAKQSGGAIAAPAKSVVSKFKDLMFGI